MASERKNRRPVPPIVDTPAFDENPEMTAEAFARARPALEVLAEQGVDAGAVGPTPRGRGRPKLDAPKIPVKIRLAAEVVDGFRATGPGWHTRIERVLADHLKKQAGTR
jgi:uncharacterized protein (DUF4415 family)